jgi:hypothetical protein
VNVLASGANVCCFNGPHVYRTHIPVALAHQIYQRNVSTLLANTTLIYRSLLIPQLLKTSQYALRWRTDCADTQFLACASHTARTASRSQRRDIDLRPHVFARPLRPGQSFAKMTLFATRVAGPLTRPL